jgi:hypothetical protein
MQKNNVENISWIYMILVWPDKEELSIGGAVEIDSAYCA